TWCPTAADAPPSFQLLQPEIPAYSEKSQCSRPHCRPSSFSSLRLAHSTPALVPSLVLGHAGYTHRAPQHWLAFSVPRTICPPLHTTHNCGFVDLYCLILEYILKCGYTMEMMLDKKQIQAVFLFEFRMGRKTVETACNVNNTFGPGTANKRTVQWWFKKFFKGDESLEDEEHSGQLSKVDNDQLRANIEADPLKTKQEVAEELKVNHSMVVRHLKQIGKVKKLRKWVPHELTENLKNRRFEWLDQEKAPKHFPKPDVHQKKVMVTVCFLNPGEIITSEKYAQQIDEMHRKLGPVLHDNARLHITQPVLQKLNKLGYEVLPHPPSSPYLLPTNYYFFKHLDDILQGKCFHDHQEAENAFQEFIESQSMDFYATGISTFISH
ncbi:hypothetical protein FD755_005885, partial [Muntiacus reevesi]